MAPGNPKENPDVAKPLQFLIADDSAEDVERCLLGLKKSGLVFEAESVSTSEEFRRKLKERPVDILLSDYNLNGWTGMDAATLDRIFEPFSLPRSKGRAQASASPPCTASSASMAALSTSTASRAWAARFAHISRLAPSPQRLGTRLPSRPRCAEVLKQSY